MNDADLLVFGCAVSFIALAGCYVFLRERYMTRSALQQQPVRLKARARRPSRVS